MLIRGRAARQLGMLGGVLACTSVAACSSQQDMISSVQQQVIYGDDNRQDLYLVADARLRELAMESSVALMRQGTIRRASTGGLEIHSPALEDAFDLCPSEPFASQPSAAECSGVLVDDDLVLTAAHCVHGQGACEGQTWAFGFGVLGEGVAPELHDDDVYHCLSVLVRDYGMSTTGQHRDDAVIRLDRPVSAGKHATTIATSPVAAHEAVSVIGYPSGLPVKVDSAAEVLDDGSMQQGYISLKSDSSVGSSGSGVFNRFGELVAVEVSGLSDYVYDQERQCYVSRRATNFPGPDQAERASNAADAIKSLCECGWSSQRLCGAPAGRGPEHTCWSDIAPPAPGCQAAPKSCSGQACGVVAGLAAAISLLILSARSRPRQG